MYLPLTQTRVSFPGYYVVTRTRKLRRFSFVRVHGGEKNRYLKFDVTPRNARSQKQSAQSHVFFFKELFDSSVLLTTNDRTAQQSSCQQCFSERNVFLSGVAAFSENRIHPVRKGCASGLTNGERRSLKMRSEKDFRGGGVFADRFLHRTISSGNLRVIYHSISMLLLSCETLRHLFFLSFVEENTHTKKKKKAHQ